MKQLSEVFHSLEIRHREGLSFVPAIAGMYRPAQILAYQGEFCKALTTAADIQIENYGQMQEVRFRIVTTIKTITVLAGDFE